MSPATITVWADGIVRPHGVRCDYEFDRLRGRFGWTFRRNGALIKQIFKPDNVVAIASKIVVDIDK